MITTKEDLKNYIEADQKALGILGTKTIFCIGQEVGKFELAMRKLEYHFNKMKSDKYGIIHLPFVYFWRTLYHNLSIKCGFDIPINTFGKGLNLHHRGMVIVNANAIVGDYCDILPGVVIGQNRGGGTNYRESCVYRNWC